MKQLFPVLIFCLLAVGRGQDDFDVYADTLKTAEGNQTQELIVTSGKLRFTFRPLAGWYREVNETERKIILTSPTGGSAVLVRFRNRWAGKLPEKEVLQAEALQEHPGAGVFSSAVCPTSYQPGLFFDLALTPAPNLALKIRHAFVPEPAGEVEFILSASEAEFSKNARLMMVLLNGFRVDAANAKEP